MPIKRFYRLQRAHLASAPIALRPAPSRKTLLLRGALVLLLLGALIALGGWWGWIESKAMHWRGYDAQAEQIADLERRVEAEVSARRLAEQQLAVEVATREALAKELAKAQEDASARLETLFFLESLLTANDRSRAVRFFACELLSAGERKFRYRALLAQGTNSAAEFDGRLVIDVDYQKRGKRARFIQGEDKPLPVHVKHYGRLEGVIELPADAQPLALEARILSEDGRQLIAQCKKKMGGV